MKKIFGAILMCVFCASAHAANNCTGATYYDADSDTCITCPAGYDYNTDAGKSAATQCQANCAAGKWNGEYTQLEYIESTGTQYIDTGIQLTSNTQNITAFSNVEFLESDSDYANHSRTFYVSTPNAGVQVYTNGMRLFNQELYTGISLNTRYTVKTETTATARNLTVNGVDYTSQFNRSITDDSILYLFANETYASNNSGAKIKLYDFKVYKNNVLVRDFIPARRNSDNVLGMYDTVSGTFFTNAGSGTFVAGPDVGGGIGACTDVGAGYYGAGGTTNFGTAITRTQCTGATYCTGGIQINCPSGYDYNTTAGKTAVTQCQTNCTTSQYIPTVPSTYTVLEYLESTGTQYIDTGVVATSNTKVETVVDRPISPTRGTIWCPFITRNDVTNGQYGVFESTGVEGHKYIALPYGFTVNSALDTSYTGVKFDRSKIILDGGVLTYDTGAHTLTSPQSGQTFNTTHNIWLFIRENVSTETMAPVTMYYIKIWDGDNLVRNMVPVRRNSDNVLGMYDTVSGTFFTNAGSGTFVAGPVGGVTCTDVGVGYSSAGGVINFGSSLSRTPNTITISWAGANGTYETGSCTYGGGFNTPATPPTRRGYRFDGWTFVTE